MAADIPPAPTPFITLADVESRLSMGLEDAITTQRAIRRLRPDPVDDAIVVRLIELALKAPTGSNGQNWEFVIVKDAAAKAKLARAYAQAWAIYGRLGRRVVNGDEKMHKVLDAVGWQVEHFAEVPVLVVACLRGSRAPLLPLPPIAHSSYYGSIYPSVQNLLLGARAIGLGAGIVTLPLWSTTRARAALGLPMSVLPCCVVPLGWPRGHYGPTTRKPAGDVIHLDRYGHQPFKV